MIELSIIIVTWNCRKYFQEFFESIEEYLNNPSTQVIVVDNASTDGGPDFIATNFPGIQLIRSERNLGFARANNVGLALAEGEFICLINPDVKVLPGCFARVIEAMRRDEAIGLLGPTMLGKDGCVHRSTMRFPTVWNCLSQALALDVLFGGKVFSGQLMRDFKHDETREVEVLNGWFWMTRRRALQEVGPLDERFFMYGEDIDFCRRFCDSGWKRVYLADAAAVHYGGGSSSNASLRFYIEQQRANLQYFKKHHTLAKHLGFIVSVWIYHLVRIMGHSVKYVVSRDREAGLKIQRSTTCVRWLLGMSTGIEGVG